MTRFRLARVLALREQLRRLRQIEAERAAAHRAELDRARAALSAAREAALALRPGERGDAGGVELRLAHGFEEALAARQAATARALAKAEEVLGEKREALARERREERRIEHLAACHAARVAAADALALERLLDELTLARHARERREDEGGARART